MKHHTLSCILFFLLFWYIQQQAIAETRILFLGDSITAGYGIEKDKAYPALVDAALKQKGLRDIRIIDRKSVV